MQSEVTTLPTAKSPRMKNHLQQQTSLKKVTSSGDLHKEAASPTAVVSKLGPSESSQSPGGQTKESSMRTVTKSGKSQPSYEELLQSSGLSLPTDLRSEYTARTIEALNQFSQYTKSTVTDQLDLRCEFDLPRFKDLTSKKPLSVHEDH